MSMRKMCTVERKVNDLARYLKRAGLRSRLVVTVDFGKGDAVAGAFRDGVLQKGIPESALATAEATQEIIRLISN